MNFLDGISKQEFIDGEWHIHTSYTDGKNSVEEYCKLAEELNLTVLTFTEHVRKELSYNFKAFINDIEVARERYPGIKIRTGCEAKVLPDGELDCTEKVLELSDYVLFAFHSFHYAKSTYIKSLKKVIQNFHVNAWAHPGLYSKKYGIGLEDPEIEDLFGLMIEKNIYLEVNYRYSLPIKSWLDIFLKLSSDKLVVLGGDVHSLTDMRKCYSKRIELIESYNNSHHINKESLFRWMIRNYNKGD
jgi:DNA polymerase (family 10)/putative hydrolase